MAFDFPNSPTTGQVYAPIPGLGYTWTGTRWELSASPGTALPFNMVVNPNFQISQENGDNAGGQSFFPADLWHMEWTAGGPSANRTSAQGLTPNGSRYRLRCTNTTSRPFIDDGGYAGFVQYIEGYRVAQLAYGWPHAKQSICRFLVKAPAGTWSFAVRNGDSTRGRAFTYTISAGEAGTLVERIIVIPPDITGPTAKWPPNNVSGLHIWFTFCNMHTSLQATPGSWVNGNIIAAPGMTNGLAVANNVFEIADVGLYLDPFNTGVPPKWESRTEQEDYIDCLRYWYPCRTGIGVSAGANASRVAARHPVPMRTAPSCAIALTPFYSWDAATIPAINSVTNYSNSFYFESDNPTASAMSTGLTAEFLPDYAGYIAVNARP